jgi:hypothetical protein
MQNPHSKDKHSYTKLAAGTIVIHYAVFVSAVIAAILDS